MKSLIILTLLCGGLCPQQTVSAQQKIVTAAQVGGTWQSKLGTFKIWSLGNQKLQVEFFGTYQYKLADGTPTANEGEASGIAIIENRLAVFKPEEAENECSITMEFNGSNLSVKQKGFCGFGYNVTASGKYRKMNGRKPKFND